MKTSKFFDCDSIDCQTLSDLIIGKHDDTFENIILIDCRYDYEYSSGHIINAININQEENLKKFYESSLDDTRKTCIIFYCQYSAHNGPNMYKYFRNLDREKNSSLSFPDVYLLEGGYKGFYENYKDLCNISGCEIKELESNMMSSLPLYIKGPVVKGYGRGSSQLGFPTANISPDKCKTTFTDLDIGVYYGWSFIEGIDDKVEPMVMSVGWNPTFENKEKSFEIYVIKNYENDFYGRIMRAIAVGFIRDMVKFNGIDELIKAIQKDIEIAKAKLSEPESQKYTFDKFFKPENESTKSIMENGTIDENEVEQTVLKN